MDRIVRAPSTAPANGVPEGDAISEDDLTTVGEAWFAAVG